MFPHFLLISMLMFMGPVHQDQQPAAAPATVTIPPEALKMINPGKSTPATMALAKKMYGYDCEMCHGANGQGKGDLAVEQKLVLKNWTDPTALQGRTDGELYYIITNGQGAMTPEGGRVKPEVIWDMVTMVRSFSKK